MTILWESREKGEWKSRVGQISLKGRGEGRQCRPDVLGERTETMKSRKSQSREISLKGRGGGRKKCEHDGTSRK
jgi:hypothetical protein